MLGHSLGWRWWSLPVMLRCHSVTQRATLWHKHPAAARASGGKAEVLLVLPVILSAGCRGSSPHQPSCPVTCLVLFPHNANACPWSVRACTRTQLQARGAVLARCTCAEPQASLYVTLDKLCGTVAQLNDWCLLLCAQPKHLILQPTLDPLACRT